MYSPGKTSDSVPARAACVRGRRACAQVPVALSRNGCTSALAIALARGRICRKRARGVYMAATLREKLWDSDMKEQLGAMQEIFDSSLVKQQLNRPVTYVVINTELGCKKWIETHTTRVHMLHSMFAAAGIQ